MGVDCHGWVEVNDPSTYTTGSPRFPNWWSGVIRIDDIIERDYQVFGYFFNVRNRDTTALAGNRGLPVQLSQEALTEELVQPADWVNPSWMLWSEAQASDWRTRLDMISRGWVLLFDLMERLAACYGAERVRLVIGFDSQ